MATGPTRLRSDSELSVRAVATAVAALRPQGETMVEVTPVGSSSSLGAVERWSETPCRPDTDVVAGCRRMPREEAVGDERALPVGHPAPACSIPA